MPLALASSLLSQMPGNCGNCIEDNKGYRCYDGHAGERLSQVEEPRTPENDGRVQEKENSYLAISHMSIPDSSDSSLETRQ